MTIRSLIPALMAIVLVTGGVVISDSVQAGIVPKESPERFELIFWDSIKDSENAADYDAYLEAYPQGRFAPLAKARARSLRAQQAREQQSASGPQVEDMDAEFIVLKNARLRELPDASSENLGTLTRGSRLIVTGRVVDSNWFRIETMDGKSGFVFGTLIEEAQRGADQAVAEKAAADEAAREKAAAAASAQAAAREAEQKAAAAEAEAQAEEAARRAAAEEASRRAAEQAAAADKARQVAAEAAAAAAAAEAARQAAHAKVAGTTPSTADTFKDCDGCPEMIALPPGSFTMGSKGGDTSEHPAHTVTIAYAFAISRFEVSVAEWKACHAAGGCDYLPDRKGMTATSPIYNLSWQDAQKYAKWLSKKTGQPYRLPSEAEWEYAARAGTETEYWWGDAIGEGNANCKNCGGEWNRKRPAVVDTFAANGFGLQGMNGGVWEWVADCWFDSYDGAPGDGSVRTRENCQSRVLRGGSWRNDASYARSASRFNYDNDVRYVLNGFRVVRDMN